MKRTLLSIICFVILLVSCRQQEPVDQLKEINEALIKANLLIDDQNKLAYEEMYSNSKNPATMDNASIWEPRTQAIRQRASAAESLIGWMKEELIKQSDSLRSQDHAIVKRVIDANGEQLFKRLVLFEDSLATVFDTKSLGDSMASMDWLRKDSAASYKNSIRLHVTGHSKSDWLSKNFSGCSPMMALLVLNKIETNILSNEGYLVWYCNLHVGYNFCGYYKPGAMASLSSTVVKSGDTILVSAGMAIFGNMPSSKITINGNRVKVFEDPVARYMFKVTGNPGTHTLPVKIEYLDSDGSWKTENKDLRYIITENK